MQSEELARVEEALRQMCAEQDLAWLIEQVDAALHDRLAESVNPGSSSYRRRPASWPGAFYEPVKRGRPQLEIRERDYTAEERVLVLLDAMLMVYRDLPNLRDETIAVLSRGWEGRATVPDSVLFTDREYETAEGSDFTLTVETEAELGDRQRLVNALLALRGEVLR